MANHVAIQRRHHPRPDANYMKGTLEGASGACRCKADVCAGYTGIQIFLAAIVSTSAGSMIGSDDLVKNANPL